MRLMRSMITVGSMGVKDGIPVGEPRQDRRAAHVAGTVAVPKKLILCTTTRTQCSHAGHLFTLNAALLRMAAFRFQSF